MLEVRQDFEFLPILLGFSMAFSSFNTPPYTQEKQTHELVLPADCLKYPSQEAWVTEHNSSDKQWQSNAKLQQRHIIIIFKDWWCHYICWSDT